jgi:hypothetical protein
MKVAVALLIVLAAIGIGTWLGAKASRRAGIVKVGEPSHAFFGGT